MLLRRSGTYLRGTCQAFCGFAADQSAAGDFAALSDTLDDSRGLVDFELAAGEVVEEVQWLGALDDQVIDGHRDEVDTCANCQKFNGTI